MSSKPKRVADDRAIVLTYSPQEAAVENKTMHELNHNDPLRTMCGKSCEGWRMIYGQTEQPIDEKRITCTLCNKVRKSRAREAAPKAPATPAAPPTPPTTSSPDSAPAGAAAASTPPDAQA